MDLKSILEKHLKWLKNKDGGERADLSGADLSGANLYGANLYGAKKDRKSTRLNTSHERPSGMP